MRRRRHPSPAPVAGITSITNMLPRRFATTPEPMQIQRQALAQHPALATCPVIQATTLDELTARMLADDATRTHTGRLVRTVETDRTSPTGRRFRCYRA